MLCSIHKHVVTPMGVTAKPGLWTLDWTVDWTMDWTGDDHYQLSETEKSDK